MPRPVSATQAHAAAERALAEGRAQPSAVEGQLGEALAIHDERGAPIGWFVPLISRSRLVGFVQLDDALRFLRYASFDAHSQPEVGLWVDPERVRQAATRVMQAGDELGEPMFGYHTAPSRLAWRIPLRRKGTRMTIYLAGESAWVEPEEPAQ